MDMFMEIVLVFIVYFVWIEAVPPEACFANFNWDDCGQEPVRVMYYWKPGSRCEVGLWRGCLPNLNMFQDEYECVATCIYTARARAQDYHSVNDIEGIGYDETTDTTASSDDNCSVTSAGDTVTFTGGTVTSGNVNIGGENARATSSGNDQSTNSDQAGATNGDSKGTTTAE